MCEISIQCFRKDRPEKKKLLQIFQCVTVCIDRKTRKRLLLGDFFIHYHEANIDQDFVNVQFEDDYFLLIIEMSYHDECLAFWVLPIF